LNWKYFNNNFFELNTLWLKIMWIGRINNIIFFDPKPLMKEEFSLGPPHLFFSPLKSHFVLWNCVKFEQRNSIFTNPSNQWEKKNEGAKMSIKRLKKKCRGLKRILLNEMMSWVYFVYGSEITFPVLIQRSSYFGLEHQIDF
jgi:hypothetical protein